MGYDCLCDLVCDFEKKITFFKFKKLYCRFSSLLLSKILLRIFYLFILPKLYPMEHKLVKTTFDPFRTTKAASNGNHRLCLKSKPQVKCQWSLPGGQTLEGEARGPSSQPWTQPTEISKTAVKREHSHTSNPQTELYQQCNNTKYAATHNKKPPVGLIPQPACPADDW